MGTGRKFNNLSRVRPVKSDRERRRRQKVQRRRLVALGMDEAVVAKLDPRKVKDFLKRPAKVPKLAATAKRVAAANKAKAKAK